MYWTQIDERVVGNVVILDLQGRVTVSEDAGHSVDRIRELLGRGRTKIVINLVRVPYIDSLGIGDIVRGFTATQRAGGILKLCGVTGRVRSVLDAIHLSGVIEVFESEQDAVHSFKVG